MSERFRKMICANCKHDYIEGDKYCRYCGARMGKPEFKDEETFAAYYGPPPIRTVHKCKKCGFTWETNQQGQNRCPKCGGYAPGSPTPPPPPPPWFYQSGSASVLEMHLNNLQDYLNNVREYVDVAFARMENEDNKES